MIDISKGGIGVLSLTKSNMKKGQNISALVSYEDKEHDIYLNFESNGILTSIIGKEHAFRYVIALEPSDKKKKLVHHPVESINKNQKKLKETSLDGPKSAT